jgi:[acyl-carrier-protein] S-malonyltransferase
LKKVAFIFPGQGSQSIGMGKDFFENSDIAKEMIANASKKIGVDFEELLFNENDQINETKYTQPAILLVSAIANRLFKEQCDIQPEFVLGHSLGEFSALVSAGAIDYLDAVELVHKRGEFMTEACEGVGAGMMALIGLDDTTVEDICAEQRESGKKVWAANYNSDGQIVLAGNKSDLESLVDTFKDAGAKRAIVLAMSVASHCPILEPAVKKLSEYLESSLKNSFDIPVISNVTADSYNTKCEAIDLLPTQLTKPVLYKQSIKNVESKVDLFIEFGNGNVLKGLNKKTTKIPTICINDMKSLAETIEKIAN